MPRYTYPPATWQNDRTMSGREFQQAMIKLGMTYAGAARYFGRGERTVYRWADDSYMPAPSEVLLLRALMHYGERPIVPPKPKRKR